MEKRGSVDLSQIIMPSERDDHPAPFNHTGTEMADALAQDINVFIPDGRTWQLRNFNYNGVQVIAKRQNGWRTFNDVK